MSWFLCFVISALIIFSVIGLWYLHDYWRDMFDLIMTIIGILAVIIGLAYTIHEVSNADWSSSQIYHSEAEYELDE